MPNLVNLGCCENDEVIKFVYYDEHRGGFHTAQVSALRMGLVTALIDEKRVGSFHVKSPDPAFPHHVIIGGKLLLLGGCFLHMGRCFLHEEWTVKRNLVVRKDPLLASRLRDIGRMQTGLAI